MKQRLFQYTVALCTALSAITLLTGCREDMIIKSSLTPAVDNIHTFGIGPDFNNGTDNLIRVSSTTSFEDSIITSARQNGFPIFHGLGWVTDPIAGRTAGSIYMQVVPTATQFKIPATTTINELVLVLPYSGFTWGDTTAITTRTINVYRITQSFSKDSTFYNFSSRETESSLIGTATIQTGPVNSGSIQDSVKVLGVNRAPHLRIKLSDAFKNEFIKSLDADSTFASFTDVIRGFYIVPDTTGQGTALPHFRLNGSSNAYGSAGLIAYGRTSSATDTFFQFPYDERYAAHFNRITRNYAGTLTEQLMQTKDSSELVMQNAPGAVFDIVLPNIQDIPKNVIINKAELVFTQIEKPGFENQKFFGPLRLYPQGINSTGGRYTIADRYPINDASLDFIDGTPKPSTRGGTPVTEYRINIPRELQKAIVQGSNSLHLRVGGTVNFPGAYRLIVGGRGNDNPAYRPSINIIYSKQ